MIDWLKKRLSPVKRDTARWKDLAEAIQEYWAVHFDPSFDALAGLRSIYTADADGQRRIAAELGYCFEDGMPGDNIPVSVAMRRMELHQKETDVPLVRALARLGFKAEWKPLYAPRADVYGTAFYTEDELEEHGLHIDAALLGLDGAWGIGEDPPVKLAADGVYLTSRAKMVLDLSETRSAELIDAARRRILQVKPLHIVFDGFQYRVWIEFSVTVATAWSLSMTKEINQHYPWPTPKLNGTWAVGTETVYDHRHLDGSWKLNGVRLGGYSVPLIVHETLAQRTVTGSLSLVKSIERPDRFLTARMGEAHLRLSGDWQVGLNRILTISGGTSLRKGPIEISAAPSLGFASQDAWEIAYPANPARLGRVARLALWRQLDGSWKLGKQASATARTLDGSWGLRTAGIKAEQSFSLTKYLGEAGVFRKVGRYTVQVGEGWSRKLDGKWKVGAYRDLDGTWRLDGSKRLGAIRIGNYYRRLDGSWKVGEVTKRLDGTWRIGQPGPDCECSITIRKAA